MSTVAEIIAAVRNLPEAEKITLFDELQLMTFKKPASSRNDYCVRTWPLGIRRDKLPSDLLAELDDEETLRT